MAERRSYSSPISLGERDVEPVVKGELPSPEKSGSERTFSEVHSAYRLGLQTYREVVNRNKLHLSKFLKQTLLVTKNSDGSVTTSLTSENV